MKTISTRNKLQGVIDMNTTTCLLVQTKIDLVNETTIDPSEAECLARELNVRFYRISVKENINIEEMFKYLGEAHLKRMKKRVEPTGNTDATANLFIRKGNNNGNKPQSSDVNRNETQSSGKRECEIS
jgi:Ras-related protein Rab-23